MLLDQGICVRGAEGGVRGCRLLLCLCLLLFTSFAQGHRSTGRKKANMQGHCTERILFGGPSGLLRLGPCCRDRQNVPRMRAAPTCTAGRVVQLGGQETERGFVGSLFGTRSWPISSSAPTRVSWLGIHENGDVRDSGEQFWGAEVAGHAQVNNFICFWSLACEELFHAEYQRRMRDSNPLVTAYCR